MTSPVSVFQTMAQDATLKVLRPTDVLLRATNSGPQQTANGNNTVLQWDMAGFASFTIQINGDSSTYQVFGSNDLDQWAPIDVRPLGQYDAPLTTIFSQDNFNPTLLVGNKQTRFVRIQSPAASSRPSGLLVLLSQQAFVPMKANNLLSPDQAWTAAAPSGGVVNTTLVTVKAAINTTHRLLVTSIQLDNGGATGTEVILTESAGSTVVWRGYLAGGASKQATFNPPLRLPANANLSLTLTAASGAQVYANAQGTVGLA